MQILPRFSPLSHWRTDSAPNLLWKKLVPLHEVTTKAWLFRLGFPLQADNSRGLCLADHSQMVKGELFLLRKGKIYYSRLIPWVLFDGKTQVFLHTHYWCVCVCVTNTFLLMDWQITVRITNQLLMSYITPWKLTYPLNNDGWKMYFLLK